MRFMEKEKIRFANSQTVPVLVDGIIVLSDSFEIAEYLEDAYSDAPLLFGGQGGQAGCKFADAFFNDNTSLFFPLIMADIWETLDKSSQEYFRKDREARYGGVRLEDLQMGREEKILAFRRSAPVREVLRTQHFLGGSSSYYAVFIFASNLLVAKSTSTFELLQEGDILGEWFERIVHHFDDKLLQDRIFEL